MMKFRCKTCTLLTALVEVLQMIKLYGVVTTNLSLGLPHPKRQPCQAITYCVRWVSFIFFSLGIDHILINL